VTHDNPFMTPSELASKIDHTILKPEATAPEVHRVVAEAVEHRFASACISPVYVSRAAKQMKGSGVLVCTVIGFPHGTSKAILKGMEAVGLIKDGADEIDVVAHLPHLVNADVDAAREELREVARAARAARKDVVIKVIIESAYLMTLGPDRGEAAIATACRAIREGGCDFVKTSTGFHPEGGANLDAVKLMKKHGEGLRLKAAGGIRDLKTALAMLDAGADRLGMSASIAVVKELGG
jgi:deoxyribose-phosphate aldolase